MPALNLEQAEEIGNRDVLLAGDNGEGATGLANATQMGAKAFAQDQRTALFNTWTPELPENVVRFSWEEMAKKIATKSAAALKLAKTAINHGMQTNLESGLKYEYELYSLSLSLEDKVEGVNAFLEKRAPKFVGR